jgi:hypothetical protein
VTSKWAFIPVVNIQSEGRKCACARWCKTATCAKHLTLPLLSWHVGKFSLNKTQEQLISIPIKIQPPIILILDLHDLSEVKMTTINK